MSKAQKTVSIIAILIFIVVAMAALMNEQNHNSNIYLKQSESLIEINFTGVNEIINHGVNYATLEEINEDKEDVFSLSVSHAIIKDPKSISKFKNLECLHLNDCEIDDFSFLKKLEKLKCLNINSCISDDFEYIKYLPNKDNLLELTISYCADRESLPITDISYLEGFTGLIGLNLGGNDIKNLEPISNMVNLKRIYLYENFHIESLKPLYNLKNITEGIIPPTYKYTDEDREHLGDPMSSNIYYD